MWWSWETFSMSIHTSELHCTLVPTKLSVRWEKLLTPNGNTVGIIWKINKLGDHGNGKWWQMFMIRRWKICNLGSHQGKHNPNCMLPTIMMRILVYNSAEYIRWAVCSLDLMHWSERVCLINCDHQLGLVGMVREDPLEVVSHFHIGSKQMHSEIRWNTMLSLQFSFGPYCSAGDSDCEDLFEFRWYGESFPWIKSELSQTLTLSYISLRPHAMAFNGIMTHLLDIFEVLFGYSPLFVFQFFHCVYCHRPPWVPQGSLSDHSGIISGHHLFISFACLPTPLFFNPCMLFVLPIISAPGCSYVLCGCESCETPKSIKPS